MLFHIVRKIVGLFNRRILVRASQIESWATARIQYESVTFYQNLLKQWETNIYSFCPGILEPTSRTKLLEHQEQARSSRLLCRAYLTELHMTLSREMHRQNLSYEDFKKLETTYEHLRDIAEKLPDDARLLTQRERNVLSAN